MTDIIPLGTWSEEGVLRIVAAVESRSEHPLGRAIIREAESRTIEYPKPLEFLSLSGKGAGRSSTETCIMSVVTVFTKNSENAAPK